MGKYLSICVKYGRDSAPALQAAQIIEQWDRTLCVGEVNVLLDEILESGQPLPESILPSPLPRVLSKE